MQRAEQHQSRELLTHSICTRGGWKRTCGTFLDLEVPSIVLASENRSVAELLGSVAPRRPRTMAKQTLTYTTLLVVQHPRNSACFWSTVCQLSHGQMRHNELCA